MHVFHDVKELPPTTAGTSVAIGNFDGCHVGHVALIRGVLEAAGRLGTESTVLTFHPHPVEVLNPGKSLEFLTTSAEKLELLERLGVERVLVARFDRGLAQLSPEEFFRSFLQSGLRAKSVHVGANFCFGRNRAGDTKKLAALCGSAGIEIDVVPPVEIGGERVSSSLIRTRIGRGDVAGIVPLLGRPYSIAGGVVSGEGKGRRLGFPTANVDYPPSKVLPQTGVYVTRLVWQRQAYRSVTNVGVKPTFARAARPVLIETHVLDFSSSLYGENVEIVFLERLREERKFGSVDELKLAIENDVRHAERYFSKHNR